MVLQCLLLKGFCQCSVPQRGGERPHRIVAVLGFIEASLPHTERAACPRLASVARWDAVELVRTAVPVWMQGLRSSRGYWACRRTGDAGPPPRRPGRWPRFFDTRSSALRPRAGGRPFSGPLTAEPACHVQRMLTLLIWWTAPSTAGRSGVHAISCAVCGRTGPIGLLIRVHPQTVLP
ncbi:hypothetical protein GCM10010216_20790 [Streptomyces flaveolus]|nr:hypothetical protein GCM10010216_20790 [Streptomyces flaveolus]